MHLCVHSKYPSPCGKAVFESTSFERKAIKYFDSAFYQRFMPTVKMVRSFDIAKPLF